MNTPKGYWKVSFKGNLAKPVFVHADSDDDAKRKGYGELLKTRGNDEMVYLSYTVENTVASAELVEEIK